MTTFRCYKTPPQSDRPARELVASPGTPGEEHFTFYNSIEIGRYGQGMEPHAGVLLVQDPTVSSRHCVITQTLDGRCFVRDMSRNGTRLDGRRLIPSLEVEVTDGQVIGIGEGQEFSIAPGLSIGEPIRVCRSATMPVAKLAMVTVLVGDIKDYTVLVRNAASTELQESVSRVFRTLADEIVKFGGTVKEYQGDAIVAFWEERSGDNPVVSACRAALSLQHVVHSLSSDDSVWAVRGFPLTMEWALATGPVFIDSFGGGQAGGLSMIGEPIVLAFRLEKFASDVTGSILVCRATREKVESRFKFKDLGEMQAKGFEKPDRVFSLMREKGVLGL
ncbi:MAG: adenylate/guanylate cyclase domain-containing protein [Candidatus Eisenbacteria bacterium]